MIFKRYKGLLIINDFELDYIGLEIKNNRYYLKEIINEPIKYSALKNGQIIKSSYLIDAIVNMKSKIKHKPKYYDLSITADNINYKNLNLPRQSRSDLRETLKIEVERIINYHFDEVVFDYSILSKDNENQRIFLVIANKGLIEDYHYIFNNTLGIINRITVRQESIWRLMNNLNSGRDFMFLEIYNTEIYLTAGNCNNLYFSRRLKKYLEELPDINEIIEMADNYIIREFNRKPISKILFWNRSNNLIEFNEKINKRIENLDLTIEDKNLTKNNILNITPLLLPGFGMIKYGN
ncbi:MAG: pilus assembly protein PilM [Bacillota bacterium]